MAWDVLRDQAPGRANKRYLELLELAAREGEARVDEALRLLFEQGEIGEGKLTAEAVVKLLNEGNAGLQRRISWLRMFPYRALTSC
jgi:hypothetical protein